MDLRTATPTEIDTELVRLYGEYGKVQARQQAVQKGLERHADDDPTGYWGETIGRLAEEAGRLEAQAVELREKIRPLTDEFQRRGGWTRAFLVTNANGHVHNTTACNTCFATTQFAWLPEFAGHDEAEIVEAAGETACTVCFPTAPVDVLRRKTTIELPERRAARLERERKAAEKAAKAAATGITNPDGTPLRGQWGVLKTERAAWIQIVDNLVMARHYGYFKNCMDEKLAENDRIVKALVFKTGQTEEEVLAQVEQKVTAKAKREGVYR